MKDSDLKKTTVEIVNINHLYKIALQKKGKELQFLNLLLLKNWIANLENNLPTNFSTKQPFSLVAIEENQIIALIVIKPINRRGTCWSISLPILLEEPKYNTLREIKSSLYKASLKLRITNAANWILKFPFNSEEEISIARELGFQPHRLAKKWAVKDFKSFNLKSLTSDKNKNPKKFNWEKIKIENANLLCKLEKSGESVNLKAIIDRQPLDLLDGFNSLSRIYISSSSKQLVALVGLIQENFPQQSPTLKIVRDTVYDLRLNNALALILEDLCKAHNQIFIETNSKDEKLNQLLINFGLHVENEFLILGKSILRRKEFKPSISIDETMDSIMGKINPANNPLPSPSTVPR